MAERPSPAVYSIPAHRAFADAFAAGIIARHGRDLMELARGIILVPNNRSVRAITQAFVRRARDTGGQGLLMPRLIPIGDVDLGERLGSALDQMGEGVDIPPAIAPMERQMILARLVQDARAAGGQPVDAGEAMRLALALGTTLDQMLVEEVDPAKLRTLNLDGDLSRHWAASLELLTLILDRWPEELARRGCIDLADRRNRLFRHIARRWAEHPPAQWIVAAGISTTAPAVCAMLRTIAALPRGMVVLSELDTVMADEDWDAIGPFEPDPETGKRKKAHESHPQYALKMLLDRIGVARAEVADWRWGGGHDARAARSRTISHAMLAAPQTVKWIDLPRGQRSLAGVRTLECANPAEEAQAIAILLREALETPGRTAALVTPDRVLAERVCAHLKRWGVTADDSAGQRLNQTPPGTFLMTMAQAMAQRFAPVPLLALLKHPLTRRGEHRLDWLDEVRGLDLLLRGPRPAPGLEGVRDLLAARGDGDGQARLRERVGAWWPQAQALLAPIEALGHGEVDPARAFAALREGAQALAGDEAWAGYQGRALAALLEEIEDVVHLGPRSVSIDALPDLLERLLECVSVRPPQGAHPRLSIYGLIEARLQQSDLMVLAGLNEGSWPQLPAPDPWLAPRIRREIGLPGLDARIGLAAHDFASGLGAPEVVITRARRAETAPAVASRFWLRLQAMAGDDLPRDKRTSALAQVIDRPERVVAPAPQPAPRPRADLRPKVISATQVDRLMADPYGFYASKILRLSRLDLIDADPTAAWRGTAVHRILELWAREDKNDPAKLIERGRALMGEMPGHPLLRAFWQPRLLAAIEWIGTEVAKDMAAGRHIALVEAEGSMDLAGVTITGRADRIDRTDAGTLALVDYKSGMPPSVAEVKAGYALQLGLLGIIAENAGFDGLPAMPVSAFEYWSLAKSQKGDFGYRKSPVTESGKGQSIPLAEFVPRVAALFADAAGRYLTGDEPFVAELRPDAPHYTDYDQLMRLEEWYGRGKAGEAADG